MATLSITSIDPASVPVDSEDMLTVNGSGFTTGCFVVVDGKFLATIFLSANMLRGKLTREVTHTAGPKRVFIHDADSGDISNDATLSVQDQKGGEATCSGRVEWTAERGFRLICYGNCSDGSQCEPRRINDPQSGGYREFCGCSEEPPPYCHIEIVWDPEKGCHCVRCVGHCPNDQQQCQLRMERVGESTFIYSCRCGD